MEYITKMKIGLSECLLGHEVRYDKGHKYDPFIVETLGQYFDFVPVCPEVECGLPTPRESMRLVGDSQNPRLMTGKSNTDMSQMMQTWCQRRVRDLEKENLVAFIFKSKSPSSGLYHVKVYPQSGKGFPTKTGVGYFARAFTQQFPLLPVEEEGRLNDPKLRETFIESIFVLKRWRETIREHFTLGKLVAFHTCHKLLFMAHNPSLYRTMGKFVAQGKKLSATTVQDKYLEMMMECLRLKTTVKKNIDVLYHIMGYFKKVLDPQEKKEIIEVFESYRRELIPLIVPITLLNFFAKKYQQNYLMGQHYLNPHPLELKLRNHA
ncbi:MAG: DUF523 and DUF1722 domain-containing protein [Pseudomonadota bacterium]